MIYIDICICLSIQIFLRAGRLREHGAARAAGRLAPWKLPRAEG